jgi:hypothetical protein
MINGTCFFVIIYFIISLSFLLILMSSDFRSALSWLLCRYFLFQLSLLSVELNPANAG